jgi:Tfp pilus assembly PilM family ATPase
MARSCGIRVGPRRFELVVLDGSPKKHKIIAYKTGELPRDGDDPIASAAAALKDAAKGSNLPTDNIGIAIDTGLAAFRTIKMPFAERAKIEQVLKFEVESLLPQWNIDDVVVDFQVLESAADASELLITAVQKQDLKRVLSVCERAGIEPQEAELETTAMVNAALTSNICTIDNAQILVHIGEQSTSVVVMDGAKVREMRAIHIGALTHDLPAVAVEAEPAVDTVPPAEPLAVLNTPSDPDEAQRRTEQAIKRIRREVGRTVSASRTVHPIDSIYVCGFDLPGLQGSTILDVPIKVLDVFEKDGGLPAEGPAGGANVGELVVAYGAALRQLGGGVLKPSLRREELRFTGAFERLELPLAVVCLLIVTLLGVWNIFLFKESTWLDANIGLWRDSARLALVGDLKNGRPGAVAFPEEEFTKYANNLNADGDRNKYEQMARMRSLLTTEIKKLEKDLGQDAEITQPQSALTAMVLLLDVLDKQGTELGRPSLRKIEADYVAGKTSGKPDNVRVSFDATYFANDSTAATQYFEHFVKDLQSQPWCMSVEYKSIDSIDTAKGVSVPNVVVTIDVSKAPPPKVSQ